MIFGTGEKRNRLELSVNECKSESARRVSQGDEAAMENHSRRMAQRDPRPARTPSSREQQHSFFIFFYDAVVQHVTYVTVLCRVGKVVYRSWETTPRNFQFSGTGVVAQSRAATSKITRKYRAVIGIFLRWFLI